MFYESLRNPLKSSFVWKTINSTLVNPFMGSLGGWESIIVQTLHLYRASTFFPHFSVFHKTFSLRISLSLTLFYAGISRLVFIRRSNPNFTLMNPLGWRFSRLCKFYDLDEKKVIWSRWTVFKHELHEHTLDDN